MEFRLTYEGPLFSTQRDPVGQQRDPRADHKHNLRKVFHDQLKRLWETTPALMQHQHDGGIFVLDRAFASSKPASTKMELSNRHAMYGFNFVPLVTFDLDLLCGIDILFLRPDRPGSVVWGGDLDNRLKTLLDALKVPDAGENYVGRQPDADEQPFFVLLEDDKLITKVGIETDRMLEHVGESEDAANVRLVITVRVKPFEMTPWNLHFG